MSAPPRVSFRSVPNATNGEIVKPRMAPPTPGGPPHQPQQQQQQPQPQQQQTQPPEPTRDRRANRPKSVIVRTGASWRDTQSGGAATLERGSFSRPPPPTAISSSSSSSSAVNLGAAGAVQKPTHAPPTPIAQFATVRAVRSSPSPPPAAIGGPTGMLTTSSTSSSSTSTSTSSTASPMIVSSSASRSTPPPLLSHTSSGVDLDAIVDIDYSLDIADDLDVPIDASAADDSRLAVSASPAAPASPIRAGPPPPLVPRTLSTGSAPSRRADGTAAPPPVVARRAPQVPLRGAAAPPGVPQRAPLHTRSSTDEMSRAVSGASPIATSSGGSSPPIAPGRVARASSQRLPTPTPLPIMGMAPPAIAARPQASVPPPSLGAPPPMPRRVVSDPFAANVATAPLVSTPMPTSAAPSPPLSRAASGVEFVRSTAAPSPDEAQHFDGDIDMRQFPFYFADVTSQQAVGLLQTSTVGSYLVRLSSRAGCFVISWVRNENAIIHSLLVRNARGEWYMDADGPAAKHSWAHVVDVFKSYKNSMITPLVRPSAVVTTPGDLPIEVVFRKSAPQEMMLHSARTVAENVKVVVALLLPRNLGVAESEIYRLFDGKQYLPSDSALGDAAVVRSAMRTTRPARITLVAASDAANAGGATAGTSAASTPSSGSTTSNDVTIIVNVPESAPLRLPVASDAVLSAIVVSCLAMAKQRGVYLDSHLSYALHAEDGELLPSTATLDSLALVRKARKKRQEPLFVLAPASGAVSTRMTVFLPSGATVTLSYVGDKRVSALVAELRNLSPLSGGSDVPLTLCALAPEEHSDASPAAPMLEAMDETRALRDVASLTNARQAGLPLRLALVRTALLGNVTHAAALARVVSRPDLWLTDSTEGGAFRAAMARVRMEHVQYHGLGPWTQASEPGASLPDKVMLQLHLPLGKKLVAVTPHETADAFVARTFAKFFADMFPAGTQPHQVALHSPAALDWVYGPYELESFEYVRQQCLTRGGKCDLVPALAHWLGAQQAPADAKFDAQAAQAVGAAADADAAAVERSHQSITADAQPWHAMNCISVGDIVGALRVCIVGAELPLPRYEVATAAGATHLRVCVGVFFGGAPLASDGDGLRWSRAVPLGEAARFSEWCDVGVAVSDLPHEARLCVTLWGCVGEQSTVPLGWTNLLLFDYRHELQSGTLDVPLWPDEVANPIGTCSNNAADGARAASVSLRFLEYALPVVHVSGVAPPSARSRNEPPSHVQATLAALATSDPLLPLTDDDKRLLWQFRDTCRATPRLLPKVLSSAPMRVGNQASVLAEIKQLAGTWKAFAAPTDALELLDARFADSTVRQLAVAYLERLTNEDLLGYLLQLVQVLKYEPYHDSALARFLLRRALGNRVVGHHLFWFLRSEMHVSDISRRFGLLLEAYLRGAGSALHSLQRQSELIAALTAAAERIKPMKDAERLAQLRSDLQRVSDTLLAREPIDSTLDPRTRLGALRVDKCKYMDSKKLPLWLVFNNANGGDDVYIIFKAGDDLRQDMLTLQMIRLMDKLWSGDNLDLQMSPYGCVATGDEIGMIEVVLNSETTAKITAAAGGVTAAFRSDPLLKWMEAAAAQQQVALRQLTAAFARSCAGYCVATYILGIGDRHNDNVMVRRTGQLFHIDFGHFLGNYKTKFGIKRESAPFVFTPDFARVLGGKEGADFADFVEFGVKAYNILRQHAALFITLFTMMLSTGIPELQRVEDIDYLRDAMMLTADETAAAGRWRELVMESLSSKMTRMNNAIHIAAH